ncbi:unnamed protein product, partial [Mesorhabditis belari]|uniref:Profilin n=1 Tax=Mesorhabditis belari TaxID=2138241 RepID=A0AAF3F3D4_9BILA
MVRLVILTILISVASASNFWVDLWQNHLAKGILRTGKFQTGAIVSLKDGAPVAKSKGLTLSNTEGRQWATYFTTDNYWKTQKDGIKAFDKHYDTIKYDFDQKIVAMNGDNGVILAKNDYTIILAMFNYLTTQNEAEKLVDDFAEYIRNLGF